jgi:ribosomal protein S18 acetylase RimI-like enzyme
MTEARRDEVARPSLVVRRAGPGDASAVRDLRLAALEDSPDDFASRRDLELERNRQGWVRWIERGVTQVLEQGGRPVGLAAGVPSLEDPLALYLESVWVRPDLRGLGGADALVRSVLAWAEEAEFAEVWLHVVKGNQRARRFYERMGFRHTGLDVVGGLNTLIEVEMHRELGSE